jgi:hypothetical protein
VYFDFLDEWNTMVKSIFLFDKFSQTRLACFGKPTELVFLDFQEKGSNRQGNDPWTQTVKQTHSRIGDKGNYFP